MSKFVFSVVASVCLSSSIYGQNYFAFENPVAKQVYSQRIKDTVKFEIIIPKAASLSQGIKYPVLVVFDRQNRYSYAHTINTIDYLTTRSAMPNSIIIGISLDQRQRNRWTLPRHRNGMAEDFMDFIVEDLVNSRELPPVEDFLFLVGHSRTAIFSSYAISRRYDKIDGIFGASISYFDFADSRQKKQFEIFLDALPELNQRFYYYFSVGDSVSGDGHEDDVMQLVKFLRETDPPENLEYKLYHERNSDHFTNYGLSIGNALNDVFLDHRQVLEACFSVLDSSKDITEVPWSNFEKIFQRYYTETGVTYYPDLTFYNSIASYLSNGKNIAKEKRNSLLLDILNKAIKHFPSYDGFYSWIARVQIDENNYDAGRESLQKSLKLVKLNPFLSTSERSKKRDELLARYRRIPPGGIQIQSPRD